MDNSLNANSWSKAETLKLIEEFKKNTILYKINHPERPNAEKRKRAFLAILYVLKPIKPNLTVELVKKKLKTLRNQFTNERRNITEAKASGKILPVEPKLWCYNELSFLLDLHYEDPSVNATSNLKVKEAAPNNESKSTITKSMEIMDKLSTNKAQSKEDAFCHYLSTELRALKSEDSFDEFKMSAMVLFQNIKAKEKKKLAESKFVWRDCPSPTAVASSSAVNSDLAAKCKRERSSSDDSILEDEIQSSNYDLDECDEENDIKCEPESDMDL